MKQTKGVGVTTEEKEGNLNNVGPAPTLHPLTSLSPHFSLSWIKGGKEGEGGGETFIGQCKPLTQHGRDGD